MKSTTITLTALSAVLSVIALVAHAAGTPPPLTTFIGKYPFNNISGYTFLSEPVVRRAVESAAFDQSVVQSALSEGVAGPISRRGSLIIASSCQPHNCADHNWTIVMLIPNGPAAVCYHDADLMAQTARWFVGGMPQFTSADRCPNDSVPPEVAAYLVQSAP